MAYYKKKQHTDGEDKIDKILYNRVLDNKKTPHFLISILTSKQDDHHTKQPMK